MVNIFKMSSRIHRRVIPALMNLALATAPSSAVLAYNYYARNRSNYSNKNSYLKHDFNAEPKAISNEIQRLERRIKIRKEKKINPLKLGILKSKQVRELFIVDHAVQDKESILESIHRPGAEIVIIQSNGIAQLTSVLTKYVDLNAIHIISHAKSGELTIGEEKINKQRLKADPRILSAFEKAMRKGGDLLLYGCELAKSKNGEDFLEIIANETEIDVAASDDLTGNAEYHGDWDLEIRTGDIEATPLKDSPALVDFTSVLQTTTHFTFAGTFDTYGAYDSGNYDSNDDVEYTKSGFTMKIDGQNSYIYASSGLGYVRLGNQDENRVDITFTGGETFQPNEIVITNHQTGLGSKSFYFSTNNGGSVSRLNLGAQTKDTIDISSLPSATTLIITGTNFGIGLEEVKLDDITTASAVSSSITAQTNNVCNGDALGSLTVTATDGSTPYTYSWSNSATSATITSLAAGTYTVTVTDGGGTTSTSSATITEPTALNTTISSQTNVACFGESTGSLTASVTGGTSPYTYNWNSGETSATITGKAAGTYTVSVLDNNGCGEGPPP